VTCVARLARRAACGPGVVCFEHSGQRIPTGVEVMHSVQIGRAQFEHDTAVSRLGWR
jgi:hypothetical protein